MTDIFIPEMLGTGMLILLGAQSFLAGLLGEMIVRPEMERADRYDVTGEILPAEAAPEPAGVRA
mgnify:CR=1 FL=1